MTERAERACVVYSGGTDSTCVAALLAERFREIHLLTFFEHGTRDAPIPHGNVERLRKRFPEVKFIHEVRSTDKLVRAISYRNYLPRLLRHGYFLLATPGFSSLSWHLTTLAYVLEQDIGYVADGLTRELMQFPGHMDVVVAEFRKLYSRFEVTYENPVREWDVPRDQQFLDRLIVDRHGFVVGEEAAVRKRTTGEYLFKLGVMPSPNVKGSKFDQEMQHDCYPFVLFNIFVFWFYLPFQGEKAYASRMQALFRELTEEYGNLLESHRRAPSGSVFSAWLA